ncbi:MAG: type II toxin-antitoxin system VapC family toxin [Proteobacteria bacterium]|nr:type II toxin-antitoxin system VapC family toxin [Pseudomonadota bacterium]
MIVGVDTNVLLRLFLKDDPEQLAEVRAMVDRVAEAGGSLYVPQTVLCELAWVLSVKAGFARDRVAEAVRGLVETAMIEVEGRDAVCAALERHATTGAGFADCLIVENALAAGASSFATFDRSLLRTEACIEPGAV